jgi:hypothetical protein
VAVYVDDLMACIPNKNWRWTESCHLIADSLDELHDFAKRIGVKRAWFQSDSRLPHYDLNKNRRAMAVKMGVTEIDRRQFVSKMRELQAKLVA